MTIAVDSLKKLSKIVVIHSKRKKGNAVLTIFEEFPHGFLQFDIKTQPHEECRKATKMVEEAI